MANRVNIAKTPNGSRAGAIPAPDSLLALDPAQQWLLGKQKFLVDDITFAKVRDLVKTWETKGGDAIKKNLGTAYMLAELKSHVKTATSVAENIAQAKAAAKSAKAAAPGSSGGKNVVGGGPNTGSEGGSGVDAGGGVEVYDAEKVALLTKAIEAMRIAGIDTGDQEVELAKQESLRQAQTVTVVGGGDRPKMEPPSKLADHPDELTFDSWIRELRLWRKAFSGSSESLLVVQMFKSLGPKTKRILQSVIPEDKLTVDRIVAELTTQYAGSVEMRGRDELQDYRHYRRGGLGMKEFLTKWKTLRTSAMAAGQLSPMPGDYWDLLESAQLPESQKLIIIGQLNERSRAETEAGRSPDMLVEMTRLLRNLSDLQHRSRHDGGGGRGGKGGTAFAAEANHVADGAAKATKPKLCKDYDQDRDCWWCETGNIHAKDSTCWWSQKGGGKGRGKGGGRGGSGGKGGFAKKTIAKTKHVTTYKKTTKGGTGKGAKGARKGAQVKSEWDDQDWVCAKCQYKTFGSRRSGTCFKCGAARTRA